MRKEKLIKIFLKNFNNQHAIIVVCFKMKSITFHFKTYNYYCINITFSYIYAYVSRQ